MASGISGSITIESRSCITKERANRGIKVGQVGSREPAQIVAFVADHRLEHLGNDDDVLHIEVLACSCTSVRQAPTGHRMPIQPHRVRADAARSDAAFLDHLSDRRIPQSGVVVFEVTTELEPPTHLGMECQEHMASTWVDHQGAGGDVTRWALAPHSIRMLGQEFPVLARQLPLMRVSVGESGEHLTCVLVQGHASPSSRPSMVSGT